MEDKQESAYEHALANDIDYLTAKHNYERYRDRFYEISFDHILLKELEMQYHRELKRIQHQFRTPTPPKNIW